MADGRDETRHKDRTSTKYAVKKAAQERVAEARAAEAKVARRRQLMTVGAAVVIVLVIIGTLVALGMNAKKKKNDAFTAAIPGVQTYTGLAQNHTTDAVNYPQTPPVGGPHNPTWLNCGVYTAPVPNENAVHDLEHGAVWITYQPDLPAAQVATIKALALAQPVTLGSRYVTVSPYPGLPSPVVASAWGVQLRLDSVNDARLAQFVDKYRLGAQTLEVGASCTGGVGSPVA